VIGRMPVRTCVGCGAHAPQRALVRVVSTAEGLRPDPRRRAPGRGAYLHRHPTCWAMFAQRRGLVRSLRLAPARAERERLVARLVAADVTR